MYDVLDTPVSPELLPPENGKIAQKTEDIVGPYELHDFYLILCDAIWLCSGKNISPGTGGICGAVRQCSDFEMA